MVLSPEEIAENARREAQADPYNKDKRRSLEYAEETLADIARQERDRRDGGYGPNHH